MHELPVWGTFPTMITRPPMDEAIDAKAQNGLASSVRVHFRSTYPEKHLRAGSQRAEQALALV